MELHFLEKLKITQLVHKIFLFLGGEGVSDGSLRCSQASVMGACPCAQKLTGFYDEPSESNIHPQTQFTFDLFQIHSPVYAYISEMASFLQVFLLKHVMHFSSKL
jgi:hypothetical protein